MRSTHSGTRMIKVPCSKEVILIKELYTPDSRRTLVSGGQLRSLRYEPRTLPDSLQIVKATTGEVIVHIHQQVNSASNAPTNILWKIPDIFFVEHLPATEINEVNLNESTQTMSDRMQTMHDRFGHTNFDRFKYMVAFDTGENMKTQRMHFESRQTTSNRSADRPLARVGSDLMGYFSHCLLQAHSYET